MISGQASFNLSPYSVIYDLVVAKDNFLRKINDLVDFTFVYEELESKYCLLFSFDYIFIDDIILYCFD